MKLPIVILLIGVLLFGSATGQVTSIGTREDTKLKVLEYYNHTGAETWIKLFRINNQDWSFGGVAGHVMFVDYNGEGSGMVQFNFPQMIQPTQKPVLTLFGNAADDLKWYAYGTSGYYDVFVKVPAYHVGLTFAIRGFAYTIYGTDDTQPVSGLQWSSEQNPESLTYFGGDGRIGFGTITPADKVDVRLGNSNFYIGNNTPFLNGYLSFRDGMSSLHPHALWMINTGLNGGMVGGITNMAAYNQAPDHGIYFVPASANNWDDWTASMSIKSNGHVGIGTNNPTSLLTVSGVIHSQEVKVTVDAGTGPDYVFEPTYNLTPLDSVAAYIREHKHLPEVPSAKQMEEEGMNLREMNLLLLKKVEELTLHLIEQQKQISLQNSEIEKLKRSQQ